MGGLASIGMVADFSRQVIDAARLAGVLSHELARQVHGARAPDPGQWNGPRTHRE